MSIFRQWKLPAIALLGFVLATILAEGAFRLAGVRRASLTEGVYQPFLDGSFRLQENASAYLAWYPRGFHVYTNEAAVRVAKGESGWTRGPVGVVIAGDSQCVGWGLEYEKAFGGIFEGNCRGADVSVANIAVGAHTLANQQEVLAWLREHRGLRARRVLLCMTASQVSMAGKYVKRHVYGGGLYTAPPSAVTKAKIWASSQLALYTVVRDAWKNSKAAERPRFLDIFEKSREQERHAKLRVALEEFRKECARCGASLVIAFLPVSFRNEIDGMDPSGGLDGNLPGRLCEEVAEELGVPFIDFGPLLRRLGDKGVRVALEGDPHYSEEMNAACAQLLWKSYDWAGINRRKQ